MHDSEWSITAFCDQILLFNTLIDFNYIDKTVEAFFKNINIRVTEFSF